jgi:hypothetical protein
VGKPDTRIHQEEQKELARYQKGKTVRKKGIGDYMSTGPFKMEMML